MASASLHSPVGSLAWHRYLLGLALVLAGHASTAGQSLNLPLPAVPLNSNAGLDSGADRYPKVATDSAGRWIAVWTSTDTLGGALGTDYDILVSRSSDNGLTWSAPQALNSNAPTDTGTDTYPWLATDNAGQWICVWYTNDTLGGTKGADNDIVYSRSTDNGLTWSAIHTLNSNAGTDTGSDQAPVIEVDATGAWIVAWCSSDTLGGTKGSDFDILVSRSTDDGATWTAVQVLNSNAGTDTGADYNPRLVADQTGNWVAVWYSNDTLGGTVGADNDIFLSTSSDSGATWAAVRALNTNATTDVGSDSYPCATTDGLGHWVVAWQSTETLGGTIGTDNDILYSCSSDNGLTWTASQALNSTAPTDTADDNSPYLLADGQGNWVASWNTTHTLGGTIATDADIVVARSSDCGSSWSSPQALTTTAAIDRGSDLSALAATDGDGHWLAVWNSDEDLQGTIGTDYDIFIGRFAEPDCDANGILDSVETDTDNDGTIDACDNCSLSANADQADADGDHVGDICDACPNDSAKTSAGRCGCGVPETDIDGDGTPDCIDLCNGSDLDTDGDGRPNCLDECPHDPQKTSPGVCGCGQPDTDTDADGIPDCLDGCNSGDDRLDTDHDQTPDCRDGCPNDSGKTSPGVCGCGAPDTDSDSDGVPNCLDICEGKNDRLDTDGDGAVDCLDTCPGDPRKTYAGACGCGLPDEDQDEDGIPDCYDACGGVDDRGDSDGDGIVNCRDICPQDPHKSQEGACGCGVPDTDGNDDGIPDCYQDGSRVEERSVTDRNSDGGLTGYLATLPACGAGTSAVLLPMMIILAFLRIVSNTGASRRSQG